MHNYQSRANISLSRAILKLIDRPKFSFSRYMDFLLSISKYKVPLIFALSLICLTGISQNRYTALFAKADSAFKSEIDWDKIAREATLLTDLKYGIMPIEIKPRHIRELRTLPISEMTDEEIAKAACDRLGAKTLLLVYDDGEQCAFLGRYKKGGYHLLTCLQRAWEEKFGKFKKFECEE